MVASLWHQLLGTKVRLLVGLLAGVLRGGSMRACGGGSANHYLFGMQTNSEMDTNHYLFGVQTNSEMYANHYSFVVQTYSGSRVDLYRSQLPSHGGGGGASGGGGSLALRAHLRL